MCVSLSKVRRILFTGFQTRFKNTRRERHRAFVSVAVCLSLLALLTVAQVTHSHPANTDADRCPLCIVMHTASPVAATAAPITLVQIAVASPLVEVRGISRHWHP